MFRDSPTPQNEETPFRPRGPSSIAKIHAYWMAVNCREFCYFLTDKKLFNGGTVLISFSTVI
jgi:GDPmannose 4,6-dehydratase